MKAQIRDARPEDMKAVHDLIRELAIYEKAASELVNTVEQLKEDGFGNHKIFDCIVAEFENEIIGFALFYTSYSTWKGKCLYLEDFLVTEKHRGKGVGKQLFEQVYSIAKARKVGRFEWQVLDWNQTAIDFYKKYDAEMDGEWFNAKIQFR